MSCATEAVFGSRMIESGTALKGVMPLYKYVGNKKCKSCHAKKGEGGEIIEVDPFPFRARVVVALGALHANSFDVYRPREFPSVPRLFKVIKI